MPTEAFNPQLWQADRSSRSATLAQKQVHVSLFMILSEIPFVSVAAETKTTTTKENTDENRHLTSEFNRDKQ